MSPDGRNQVATLDTRGQYCPVPIVWTRKRLEGLRAGALLEVLTDDPVMLEDMPAFCASYGHDYLGHREEAGEVWRLRLRKSGGGHG